MPHYVYIVLCEGGSFYTGCTKDLDARMKLHMNGKGARYTRMHRAKKLIYYEEFDSRAEAMRRERKVKTLKHNQKLRLANSRRKRQMTRKERRLWNKRGKKAWV